MSKILSFKKEYISYVFVILAGLLMSALAANAASTVALSISTGAHLYASSTLTVGGAINASSTLATSDNITVVAGYGLDTAGGGLLNLGTTTATGVVIGSATAKVGISSTTPFAALSVNTIGGSWAFMVGSSTGTYFSIDRQGKSGVGTSTPYATLSVNSLPATAAFAVGSSSGQSLVVDRNGFVGVASSSPYTALAVVGTTTTSGLVFSTPGIESGTGINRLIAGNCTLISPSGAGATIAASTTKAFDCAVTNASPNDNVIAQVATSTAGNIMNGAGGFVFTVVGAKASSTAGYITLVILNLSGIAAQPSMIGYGSTTAYWLFR